MPSNQAAVLLHHVCRLLGKQPAADGLLLKRFRRHGDEAAFEALMRRHGPLVWSISRRGTGHEQAQPGAAPDLAIATLRPSA
jgi:hypothetical protein